MAALLTMLGRFARLIFMQAAYFAAVISLVIFLSIYLESNYEGRQCFFDDDPCTQGLSVCIVKEGHVDNPQNWRFIEESDSTGECTFVGFHAFCATLWFQFMLRTLLVPIILHRLILKRCCRVHLSCEAWCGGTNAVVCKTVLWLILWGASWGMTFVFRARPGGLVHAYCMRRADLE